MAFLTVKHILLLLLVQLCFTVRGSVLPAQQIKPLYLPSSGSEEVVDNTAPEGFINLYNGRDLQGWQGVAGNPVELKALSKEELVALQEIADDDMAVHWRSNFGVLEYDGKGKSIRTIESYQDYELIVDWKITAGSNSGIFPRGVPQIDILSTKTDEPESLLGSGGLSNNKENPAKPLLVADHKIGDWNRFFIRVKGNKVTVLLNGKTVTNNTTLENFWEPTQPLYQTGPIEIEASKSKLYFKNIFLRQLDSQAD